MGMTAEDLAGGAPAAPVVPEAPELDFHEQPLPAQDSFDRPYVEKLRSEAARYRTEAREAKTFVDNFGPAEDRETWKNLASTLYRDQKAGARYMAELAKGLGAGMSDEEALEAAGPAPAALPSTEAKAPGLTMEDVERMLGEREQQRAQADAIGSVEREAQELGYKPGTRRYIALLHTAANETGGDLQEAHRSLQSEDQAIIDAYLADKAKESGSRAPGAVGNAP